MLPGIEPVSLAWTLNEIFSTAQQSLNVDRNAAFPAEFSAVLTRLIDKTRSRSASFSFKRSNSVFIMRLPHNLELGSSLNLPLTSFTFEEAESAKKKKEPKKVFVFAFSQALILLSLSFAHNSSFQPMPQTSRSKRATPTKKTPRTKKRTTSKPTKKLRVLRNQVPNRVSTPPLFWPIFSFCPNLSLSLSSAATNDSGKV